MAMLITLNSPPLWLQQNYSNDDNNSNHNSNNHGMFVFIAIARVHVVHLMNTYSALGGCQPLAKPTNLGCGLPVGCWWNAKST